MEFNSEKKCFNKCPKCGAKDDDIEWGDLQFDVEPYIEGYCLKCEVIFQEVYKYSITVYNKPKYEK